jgi:hypothetical protein
MLARTDRRRSAVLSSRFSRLVFSLPRPRTGISTPPDGDNQRSSVTQHIGLVKVTIDYNSPDVHAPNGDDRRGKIRASRPLRPHQPRIRAVQRVSVARGANENTVFTASHDVKAPPAIEGRPLRPARHPDEG